MIKEQGHRKKPSHLMWRAGEDLRYYYETRPYLDKPDDKTITDWSYKLNHAFDLGHIILLSVTEKGAALHFMGMVRTLNLADGHFSMHIKGGKSREFNARDITGLDIVAS